MPDGPGPCKRSGPDAARWYSAAMLEIRSIVTAVAVLAAFASTARADETPAPRAGEAPAEARADDRSSSSPGASPQPGFGERELVAAGGFTSHEIVAGGIAGLVAGFGIGQLIQGRWRQRGWIFFVNDVLSVGLGIEGYTTCRDDTLDQDRRDRGCAIAALFTATLALSRVLQAGDALIVPALRNRRLRRELEQDRAPVARYGVVVAPRGDGSMTLGFAMRF